jgi:PmbA protein
LEEGERLAIADEAVKKALKAGASEAEAYVQRTNTVFVTFTDKVENLKNVESTGVGLRVAVGKRTAMCSTSVLSDDDFDAVAGRAVKIARVAPEDSSWRGFNKKFGRTTVEECYDKKLEDLEYEEITETLVAAAACMKRRDKRVVPTRSFCSVSLENVSVANSDEESVERRGTDIGVFFTGKVEEAGVNSTGAEQQQARSWREIEFGGLATRAAEKAVKYLGAKPVPSGKMAVILRNQVFANLMGIFLGLPVCADWMQQGRSPFAERLKAQVASADVDVVDEGVMKGGLRTRSFDDEGHGTQKTPIIVKGVLENFLYDGYTALKDGVESTGNAGRLGYWMKPQPFPSNLVFRRGKAVLEEMIRETKMGLYVDQTIGEWLSNPVSGNLNATVTHGFLIENGEQTLPVNGVVLAGNFHELLRGGVELIGNDVRSNVALGGASVYSPTVKLAELTVAGK